MEYRILGPLEVVDGTAPLPLTGGRQRALLALLLIHRNEVVSSERLIDALWGEAPPPSAAKALQNAVLQVRRALGPEAGVLHTERRGYVLRVAPGELDAECFEQLARGGRDALDAGDAATAAERLGQALALWRGPAHADLALGRHSALVAELEAAVARHPLRERLRAQLMTALYGSGRQADALEAFHDARRTLLDELGIEPGPALREHHDAILRQDPALAPPARRRPAPGPTRSPLPLLAGAAALLLLAAAVAAAVVAIRDDDEQPASARIASVPGNSL